MSCNVLFFVCSYNVPATTPSVTFVGFSHSVRLPNSFRFTQLLRYVSLRLGLPSIHVISPGFARRLPEIYQISCSPRRENKYPRFLMKPNIFLCGLKKIVSPSLYSGPQQQQGLVQSRFVQMDQGNLAKQYPCFACC